METPVLLLVYNRPEQTLRVLQRLKECGMSNIFVSADGPKNPTDRKRTDEVRSCIDRYATIVSASHFSDSNQGCKAAVIAGIDWFFTQVDEGIILEDDCLPSPHFFPFSGSLLDRYREVENVLMISGNNPLGRWTSEGDHFFSRIGHIWGWATWKSRWKRFNPELPALQKFILNNEFERAFGPTHLAQSRKQLTLDSVAGKIDTWDYQWMTHLLMQNGSAVVPAENLVENIGFTDEGTNLTRKPNWLRNEVALQSLQTTERPIEIDREYEMELFLARRTNRPAPPSSTWFKEKGEKGEKEKRTLNIVLINSTDVGGGAEKLALMLHSRLLEFGHAVTFLVKTKKTHLDSVHEMKCDWKKQLLSLDPDVIHVHNLHDTDIPLNRLAEISKRIPVLWTLHDTWLLSGSNDHAFQPDPARLNLLDLKNWKNEFEARRTAIVNGTFRFTAPSQWMRERFFNAHQIIPFYVPNAVESVISTPISSPSERFILFIANRPQTNPYKDFETLKKGWIKANEKLGKDGIDLICVGGIPSTENHGTRTLFILERQTPEEVRAYLEKALLVVQVSRQDNAPLAILEAHLADKKVVGTLDGGIPELLDRAELNWLHEPGNSTDLANRLVEAIRSERDDITMAHPTFKSVVKTYVGHYISMTDKVVNS